MSKVFDKWDLEEVKVEDLGLVNYICLDEILVPHTLGRHVKRQFAKSKVSIVERLMNKIMRTHINSGKKNKAYSIVRDAFEVINKRSKENPLQILVKAVENTAPREEITRVKYGGIGYQVAVDIAPQRRVDLAIGFITRGAMQSAFKRKRSAAECLADELLLAAEYDTRSFAIGKKDEKERIARSAH
ncbi:MULTISPECIES: 30S ribosomal protein S7 [Methanobacterium]|jgi:small subunit ribosomal protein S7|uniref:Small ribosomal subunit protein uS7 n=1 Tax=Methanobacterium bryantii TaxID=2161 RepID=A0A2A2H5A9_METBR|nr:MULTISPECIES: 30S ribosomal protein S7 [Methanobacterium]OEC88305.1 30S ribosomal protein S7 [Methanobacterium sp. A39]PAV04494.1 30S ribosomal protein S7 [Methanobacterium bryantii]